MGWRWYSGSSIVRVGASGLKRKLTTVQLSTSRSKEKIALVEHDVEILLVEDNPNDAELALDAMRQSGLADAIRVVRDSAEALGSIVPTAANASRPIHLSRLVLPNLKLPKACGLEVLARIPADSRTRVLPAVVLTSSREVRDIVESYRLNVNSTIFKPVDFEQFSDAVGQIGCNWLLLNQPPTL